MARTDAGRLGRAHPPPRSTPLPGPAPRRRARQDDTPPKTAPPTRFREDALPRPLRPLSWARTRFARAGRDRGALSLELAIVFPFIIAAIFTAIMAGLWYHARNVALSAAQRGVETARVQGGTLDQGMSVAGDFLDRAGSSISGRAVTGSDGAIVSIEVTGRVDTFIPGLSLSIDQHASAARERVTAVP
ncbi:hypothetical protein ABH937_006318 [Kitasatospora sp. GAS1066B]